MTEICIQADFMLSLLNEVGRHRALSDRETDIVEECVIHEGKPFRWNPRLEVQLMTAASSTGGIARFCRRNGIGNHSIAYQKLHRLRKRKDRKGAAVARKG